MLPHEARHRLRSALSLTDTSGALHRGDRIIRACLLAGFVIAIAGDLDLFATCGLAIIAAVLLAFSNGTCARLVCAGVSLFVRHTSLLRKMLRYAHSLFLATGERGLSVSDFSVGEILKLAQKCTEEKVHIKTKSRRRCTCAITFVEHRTSITIVRRRYKLSAEDPSWPAG